MTDEEVHVSLIPKEVVDQVWGDVTGFIEGAADYTGGRYTVDDAYSMVMNHDFLLWATFDKTGIKGAAVTNFILYPRKKVLHIMFLGGEGGMDWKDKYLKTMQFFAFDNQCDSIEASGRPGWAKILKHDGFTPLWQTFELPVADMGLGA